MKYLSQQYAHAFWAVMDKTPVKERDSIISKFIKTVLKYGDGVRFDKIIQAIQEQKVVKDGGSVVLVEYARQQSDKAMLKLTRLFDKKDFVSTKINPSLLAGVRITVNGEHELDLSMKRKLIKLFK